MKVSLLKNSNFPFETTSITPRKDKQRPRVLSFVNLSPRKKDIIAMKITDVFMSIDEFVAVVYVRATN